MVELLIDYSDPETLARRNVSPNAGCHVDGEFYDVRNLLHLVCARETRIAELEAENERLMARNLEHEMRLEAEEAKSEYWRAEALSRTGAVKVKEDSHSESNGVE